MPPLARLPLLPQPTQGAVGDCHLQVIRADERFLYVEAPRGHNTTTTYEYALKNARFIPIYPFERSYPSNAVTRWRVNVMQNAESSDPVQHDFADRSAAFAFQRYITGYVPVGHCGNTTCCATIRRSFLLPNKMYAGVGEIQLWCRPEDMEPSTPVVQQLAPRNNVRTYVNRDQSPLLVALLLDTEDETYTMLKVNSTAHDFSQILAENMFIDKKPC